MNRWVFIDSPNSLVAGFLQCQNQRMKNSTDISMSKIDPARNMQRFYSLSIQPNLFGGYSVVRCWGRIGTQGQLKIDLHSTMDEAVKAGGSLEASKQKRGYK